MSRKHPIGAAVTIGGHEHWTIAKSRGHAVRRAVRRAIRNGEIKRQPKTDPEDGFFQGVQIEVDGERVSRLGQPTRFIELTNAARRRAGLPEKKERTRRRK